MLRIYKTYDFPLSVCLLIPLFISSSFSIIGIVCLSFFFTLKTKKASQVTTFSGYPGVLSSVDDYYLLDT